MDKFNELNLKLAEMQTKFKSKKSRFNNFGKYNFRSAEDILEAIKPFLLELGVTVTINENLINNEHTSGINIPMIESDARISDGKNAIHATAIVGVDLNQKGMQTSQQFGAASTYGKKYALGNLLLIDDTEDADAQKPSKAIDKIKQAAKPKITAEQLKKAKEYMTAGGSIDAIETKYKLTDEQRKNLTEVKK